MSRPATSGSPCEATGHSGAHPGRQHTARPSNQKFKANHSLDFFQFYSLPPFIFEQPRRKADGASIFIILNSFVSFEATIEGKSRVTPTVGHSSPKRTRMYSLAASCWRLGGKK